MIGYAIGTVAVASGGYATMDPGFSAPAFSS
jgi:hypothetical protein